MFKVNFAMMNLPPAENTGEQSLMSLLPQANGNKPPSALSGLQKIALNNSNKPNLERSFRPKISKKAITTVSGKKKSPKSSKHLPQGQIQETFLPIIEFTSSSGAPKFGWQVVLDHILNEQRPLTRDIDYVHMLEKKINLENIQMVPSANHHQKVLEMESKMRNRLEKLHFQENSLDVQMPSRFGVTAASDEQPGSNPLIDIMGLAVAKNSASTPALKRRDGAKKTQIMLSMSLNRGEGSTAAPIRNLFRARSMASVPDDDDNPGFSKPASNAITPFLQRSEQDLDQCQQPEYDAPALTVLDFKKHTKFATKPPQDNYEFDPLPMVQAKGSL